MADRDRWRRGACCLAAAWLLAGCGGGGSDATDSLQQAMVQKLEQTSGRAVSSVACHPKVDEVTNDSSVNVTCAVRFGDGSSYTTPATITNTSQDFDMGGSYEYSWQRPPPESTGAAQTQTPTNVDATSTFALPAPPAPLDADSPASLFRTVNLRRVVTALERRFGTQESILAMAIAPGGATAVIGSDGEARQVSATPSGALTVSTPYSFDGTRNAIDIDQVDAAAVQTLTREIAARGGVPAFELTSFVLTFFPHGLAGWTIGTAHSSARFRAYLLGNSLTAVTPSGTHALG